MRSLILISMVFFGCSSRSELKYEQYLQYVHNPKNGLVQSVEQNDITVTCSYRPTDLLIQQEIAGDQHNAKLVDSLKKHFENYDFFVLSYSKNDYALLNEYVDQPDLYQRTVAYLSSSYGDDIELEVGGAKFPPFDFLLSASSGSNKSTDVLVTFKSHKTLNGDISINVVDPVTGFGSYRFKFKKADLKSIPKLII